MIENLQNEESLDLLQFLLLILVFFANLQNEENLDLRQFLFLILVVFADTFYSL